MGRFDIPYTGKFSFKANKEIFPAPPIQSEISIGHCHSTNTVCFLSFNSDYVNYFRDTGVLLPAIYVFMIVKKVFINLLMQCVQLLRSVFILYSFLVAIMHCIKRIRPTLNYCLHEAVLTAVSRPWRLC